MPMFPNCPISQLPPEFLDGLCLYWRGFYWHSHEAWEDLWRASEEPQRSFLQALIQMDAALIHSERGDWRGVRNLLNRARNNLSRCPDKVLNIDVPLLRKQVEAFSAEVEAILRGDKRAFNWRRKPRLAPEGVPLPPRERLRRAKGDGPDRGKARSDLSESSRSYLRSPRSLRSPG
jgi:hypothetical protein